MKKQFTFLTTSFCFLAAMAQTQVTFPDGTTHTMKPVITMQTAVDGTSERSFYMGTSNQTDFYGVDFGDGQIVLTDTVKYQTGTATKEAAKGIAKGEGKITIYAEDPASLWLFSTNAGTNGTTNVQSIDLSAATGLHQLSVSGVCSDLETIDIKALTELESLSLIGTAATPGKLKSLDATSNKKLTSINVSYNQLESINVAGLDTLSYLNVNNNKLTTLDVSNLPLLANLYASENQLESIDMTGLTTKLTYFYIKSNKLTALNIPCEVATFEADKNQIASFSVKDATKSCKIENNCLTLATLPAKPAGLSTASKTKKFTYAPQAALAVDTIITTADVLDLSAQLSAVGELTEAKTTTYAFYADSTLLVEGTDYTVVEPGKFKFSAAKANVHCAMLNEAFPKFTEAMPFVTVNFKVVATDALESIEAVATSKAQYNLQGMKTSNGRGFVVRNGKVLFVK